MSYKKVKTHATPIPVLSHWLLHTCNVLSSSVISHNFPNAYFSTCDLKSRPHPQIAMGSSDYFVVTTLCVILRIYFVVSAQSLSLKHWVEKIFSYSKTLFIFQAKLTLKPSEQQKKKFISLWVSLCLQVISECRLVTDENQVFERLTFFFFFVSVFFFFSFLPMPSSSLSAEEAELSSDNRS